MLERDLLNVAIREFQLDKNEPNQLGLVLFFSPYAFQEENACKRNVVYAMKNCLQWRAAPAELSDMVLTMFRESGLEMKNTIGEPDTARTVVFCRAATITKTASVRSVPCAVSF